MRRTLWVAGVLAALAAGAARAEETPDTLPDFPGREDTFTYCAGCHSMTLVGRQGMDRARWDATLNWMAEKHNMPPPDPEMRQVLLDYLTRAFPPAPPTAGGGWTSPFAPQR